MGSANTIVAIGRVLAAGLVTIPAPVTSAPQPPQISAAELAGLWHAKHRFGPDISGPLILERANNTYIADIAGFTLPVRVEKGELSFEIPGDRGAFRGRIDG